VADALAAGAADGVRPAGRLAEHAELLDGGRRP
jgi:hypothetical protein